MGKYYQVFSVSISQMLVWKINFVLWRFRTVLQLLLVYFLWSTVFLGQDVVFGYERAEIVTYIILVSFLRSFVGSSRNQDVAGEIREGELTNFLLRPVSYFGWWMARDVADKVLNVIFVIFELSLLWFIFRPPLFFQSNELLILATIAASILALILYFYFSFLLSLFAFWISEVWGIRFLALTVLEFLSGGLFPLDILPSAIYSILRLTPFAYIVYFPAKIYLGQLTGQEILIGFGIVAFWITALFTAVNFLWKRGLQTYGGEGR